jgi:hypothetical protein
MTTMPTTRPVLSDNDLARMIDLIKGSDSVELKLTVPETHQRSTVANLGMDPLNAQIRQVFFFDTPDLTLDAHGVVVRARRMQGRDGDAVVKLRPVDPSRLPPELRKLPNFRVEVDALPGGYVCSGTLKATVGNDYVRDTVKGERSIKKLFTKEQKEYYAEHAPEGIALGDLTVLGPIFVLKQRFMPDDFARRLVAEMWLYPDGSRVLELSTRCTITDAFQAAVETRAYLAGRGVDLSGEQETKTKKALEFFSAELRAANGIEA